MTGRGAAPAPSDEAVQAMIEARADRAEPVRFDAELVAREAVRRARLERPRPALLPRLAVAGASIAAGVGLTVVIALPLGSPSASAPPSSGPSPSSQGSASPTPRPAARLLTPDELGGLVSTRADELDGTIVAVQGRLALDPSMPCAPGEICANTLLADSGAGIHLRPIGDIGPGPWDGSGPKDGTFAVRITAKLEGGRPVVEYIGDLVNRDDGTFVVSVADIVGDAIRIEGAYAAVDGWLVRGPLHPCASNPRPPAGPTYGCPDDDWLTASQFQPLHPDGSSLGPTGAIAIPSGSYDEWAPDPARFGPDNVGVEPRRATYLMWLVMDGCGPNADCYQGPETLHWRIVGRLDPIPDPPAPTLPTTAPVGGADPGGQSPVFPRQG